MERDAAHHRSGRAPARYHTTGRTLRRLASGLILAVLALLAGPASAQPQPSPALPLLPDATRSAERRAVLDAALATLQPQRPGIADVYVVTAGTWNDAVFSREAASAARVLEARYAAEGRTLVLNMGGDPALPAPMATPENFIGALEGVGRLMDPAEDVLVLFMTSHGSLPTGISFHKSDEFSSGILPHDLRAQLDRTGAVNRIVILSACHSGMFVPALRSPTTVVLTAAHRDRVSFGCEPQNSWTYFGEALFANALTPERQLLSAFDHARTLISTWEKRDRLPPSLPQKFVGEQAPSFLARIEPRLAPAP